MSKGIYISLLTEKFCAGIRDMFIKTRNHAKIREAKELSGTCENSKLTNGIRDTF